MSLKCIHVIVRMYSGICVCNNKLYVMVRYITAAKALSDFFNMACFCGVGNFKVTQLPNV